MKKDNPILGIADWLAKEARLDDAQVVLKTVHKSKVATEDDKKKAFKMVKAIKEKSREEYEKRVKKFVVMKNVSDLKPHKEIEEKMVIKLEDFNRIRDDIEERGVQVPIVVNDANEVICGITRWKACKEIGIEVIPVFEGNFDVYEDMFDYAVKDNVMRRQLTGDERITLTSSMLREKAMTVVGRPPGIPAAAIKKADKALQKTTPKITKTTPKPIVIDKEYNWVVGKDHHKDAHFAKAVSNDVEQQIDLLKTDKAHIKVSIKYEVWKG